ncbi:MAG: cell division protein ZapA [Pseudomonadota bacterium]|nr:cell division protein ZapA [Gammaproteobacteria bacterium]MBU1558880.1 cell division protein ZapA [Gammaproteobacteria bacterium]MBU1628744.1 cell division protein ZapA [Gammaproteobacteria bacterium]MBU1926975.1 cell division protein ZapA [Gammaproteobacteria bacterium]MBU2545586.1 cell division protein ZapA [Gammaproteobacteria bacterium]
MTDQANTISVEVLGRSYKIKCPVSEVEALKEAAAFVDKEMRKIHDDGRVVGLDRVAIIASLNIAHLFLSSEHREDKYVESLSERIADMQKRIVELLTQSDQKEF